VGATVGARRKVCAATVEARRCAKTTAPTSEMGATKMSTAKTASTEVAATAKTTSTAASQHRLTEAHNSDGYQTE